MEPSATDSPSAAKAAAPAARHQPHALGLSLKLLSAPRAGWTRIDRAELSAVDIVTGATLLWALIPAIAVIIDLLSRGITGGAYGVATVPSGVGMLIGALCAALLPLAAAACGAILSMAAGPMGGRGDMAAGIRITLFAATPVFIGMLMWALPGAWWLLGGGIGAVLAGGVIIPAAHQKLQLPEERVLSASLAGGALLLVATALVATLGSGVARLVLGTRAAYWP